MVSPASWSVTAKVPAPTGVSAFPKVMTGGSAFSLTLSRVGTSSPNSGGSFTPMTVTITFTVAVTVDGSLILTRRTYSPFVASPASSPTGSVGLPVRDVASSSRSPASAPAPFRPLSGPNRCLW